VKFDFIAAESVYRGFNVKFMCHELGVSTSGYYDYRKRGISQRERDEGYRTPNEYEQLLAAA